jgi:AcrR family transcriptional regulator
VLLDIIPAVEAQSHDFGLPLKISYPIIETQENPIFMHRNQNGLSSREKLLRAAETLFAAKGFKEVSVREIAATAKVNSALVGYYFGGKQALFDEVYQAHAIPLSRERMKRLSAITRNGRKPSVEEVLKAWLLPWLHIGNQWGEGALNLRMTANISMERWGQTKKALPVMERTHTAYIKVLKNCLPYLSKEMLMWRMHFLMGAFAFGVRVPGPLLAFSRGRCDPTDLESTLNQMLPYAAAGFSAPAPPDAK